MTPSRTGEGFQVSTISPSLYFWSVRDTRTGPWGVMEDEYDDEVPGLYDQGDEQVKVVDTPL